MKKLILIVLSLLLYNTTVLAKIKNISFSIEQDYWSMEKIKGTTHNTKPFQAMSLKTQIDDFEFNYIKSISDKNNAKDSTYFEKIFLAIPTIDFESSLINTFIDKKTYKSLLQLNQDFIFYDDNGNTELKTSSTKLTQDIEVKEFGFNWKAKKYDNLEGGWLIDEYKPNLKLSYKEYERPFNPSSNKIGDVKFKTVILAVKAETKKPTDGYGFYNNGISLGIGLWGDLELGDEKLSDTLDSDQKVTYLEASIEPRFIYHINKNLMFDCGYLYKYTKFSISNSNSNSSQNISYDNFQRIDISLNYKF
jgi:hypothetical protein